jgi:hypothetical protein
LWVVGGVTSPREPPTQRSHHRHLPKGIGYRFDASGSDQWLGAAGGRYSSHGWLVSEMAPPRAKYGRSKKRSFSPFPAHFSFN